MVKVNFEIDDEVMSFDVPDNWNEVTVGQFMELIEKQEKNEYKTPLQATVGLIKIFTKIPEDVLMLVPVDEFDKIVKLLDFTKEEVETTEKDSIMIDGEEYFVKKDYKTLTMGETITIETLLKDENPMLIMDKLLCVFLRKKTKKGNLETFRTEFLEDRSEMIKKISISDVYNTMVFFSGLETS